ncbi:MAG: arylsulfatase [Gemmatimonadota bacterium]
MVRAFSLFTLALLVGGTSAFAQERPNILVIMGDDIGIPNISHLSFGMMGYQTPNIDRIAKEGMLFTDYYAEQSCTAGRSAFILGQSVLRTGLSKVGVPGASLGIQDEDPTLAELLKPLGYATGQFGKNHLGDLDRFLPTEHGFDEFFGNLYHLNAEEEPERYLYPKDPAFAERWGPRGVIRSYADGRVEDTGPLTQKRMETVDEEFLEATVDFIDRAVSADTPFFVWFNSSRMHFYTHVPANYYGRSGLNEYADGMLQHDDHVGVLLDQLDELGIAENTIVIYTTDNGVHLNEWPDAAITPFRGEKNTNWEGGYRVPAFVRWPGKVAPGSVSNAIMSHLDWVPTLMAAVGEPNIIEQLKVGHTAGDRTYKVHLDGYNFLPHLTGEEAEGPRREFLYFNDDGLLVGVRVGRWKFAFAVQRARQQAVWREPFVQLRLPLIFDLRMDPYERAELDSNVYNRWHQQNQYLIALAMPAVSQFLASFREFPPRQTPPSLNLERITEMIRNAIDGGD